ncbi:heterokaryon incompatibility protein-domain-containing protein [Xylariaceae sp. AK1471]|nr:heterokaryon incompatibility protein-domain-containing protein [Xylariaceae sp. AK1471]
MRLIHTRTLKFHNFEQSSSSVPRYAILSHTWGKEEVTFRDMSSELTAALIEKEGYIKITQTCRLALKDNLEYAWIDTCCIDKSSSAELSESINSMFKWYENAAICYAFLSDYIPGEMELKECRWWSRGWTLQELLAPQTVVFYDATWEVVGTKVDLVNLISGITKIQEDVLLDKKGITLRTVSQRMSWAVSRQTTRIEDEAYCLLGIFEIHMPLLYGEGRMAFRRLQEEIIKRKADLTIFYWDVATSGSSGRPQCMSLFAESPGAFGLVPPLEHFSLTFPEFFITNKGVLFSNIFHFAQVRVPVKEYCELYGLILGRHTLVQSGILLRKIGPGLFCRDGRFPAQHLAIQDITAKPESISSFYILADPPPTIQYSMTDFRNLTVHIPYNGQFRLTDAVPCRSWDATDRLFLSAPRNAYEHRAWERRYSMIIAIAFEARFRRTNVPLVVLCQDVNSGPRGNLRIFKRKQYLEQSTLLFGSENREESIPSSNFQRLMPDIAELGNCVEVTVPNNRIIRISVSLQKGTLEVMSDEVAVWELVFDVEFEKRRKAIG